MSSQQKGYQYEWFNYHWENDQLIEDESYWHMDPYVYDTKAEAEREASAHAAECHTQTNVLYCDGDDWHYQQQPPQEPDFEAERKRVGTWIAHNTME